MGNTAISYGGVAYGRDRARIDFVNCTIYGNRAEEGGGAIAASFGFSPLFKNSILWNNGAGQIYCVPSGNGWPSIYALYSDIEGGRDAVDLNGGNDLVERWDEILNADPRFVDPDEDDFHLRANSPCIDAGDPDSPRDPDGTRADMGAYPFHQRDIDVPTEVIVFPPTLYGQSSMRSLEVSNIGWTPLEIDSIYLEIVATIEIDSIPRLPFNLGPGESFTLDFTFHPLPVEALWNVVNIESDDPDEPIVRVGLRGEVIESVEGDSPLAPTLSLSAFPNPFNSAMTIEFDVPVSMAGKIMDMRVVDLAGRIMENLTPTSRLEAGRHLLNWDANRIPAGFYLIQLEIGGHALQRKVVLLK